MLGILLKIISCLETIKALTFVRASLVGMAGFEPTTSSTPCWRDTGLRYIPFIPMGWSV